MNFEVAEKIAKTVLYEGYMLYPYRPSALKNQQRWNFGTLYPPAYEEVRAGMERAALHAECLVLGAPSAALHVRARFLQPGSCIPQSSGSEPVERNFDCSLQLTEGWHQETCTLAAEAGSIGAAIRVACELATSQGMTSSRLFKLGLDLVNESESDPAADREQALSCSLLSAHLMLGVEGGEFVSLLDPRPELQETALRCKSIGCFPVLVGEEQQRNMLLCSPIILYDFPQIAPESAGDFFDGTEMDEMLTLRVITMTDEEKQQMNSADTRLRDLLSRTEQTAREQLARTHGTIRSMRPVEHHE